MNRWQCGGKGGDLEAAEARPLAGMSSWGGRGCRNPRGHLFPTVWDAQGSFGWFLSSGLALSTSTPGSVISLPVALFKNYFKITSQKLSIQSCQSLNTVCIRSSSLREANKFDQLHTVNHWMSPERQPFGLSSLINAGYLITRNIITPNLMGY